LPVPKKTKKKFNMGGGDERDRSERFARLVLKKEIYLVSKNKKVDRFFVLC
jgi:hypothetical protein